MGVNKCFLLKGWSGEGVSMPPDLSQQTRPLQDDDSRSPPQPQPPQPPSSSSCGGLLQVANGTAAIPTPTTTTCNGTMGRNVVPVGRVMGPPNAVTNRPVAAVAPVIRNTYVLSTRLREAFASVGANDSAYSFREILLMLKAYLFSNSRLFDPIDRNYVNCKNDPLEKAFGVPRFHFTDVRNLLARNIIVMGCTTDVHVPPLIPPRSVSQGGGSNGNPSRVSVLPPGGTNTPYLPAVNGRLPSSTLSTGVTHNTNTTNQGTPAVTLNTNTTNQVTPPAAASSAGTQESGPLPGPSTPQPSVNKAGPIIPCPEIPEPSSEAETVYSVQGYETELCRNTEYYSTDEDEFMTREEQEEWNRPAEASTSRQQQQQQHQGDERIAIGEGVFMEVEYDVISDNEEEKKVFSDSDSSAGVVGLVLATCSVKEHKEEVNGGFCPDADSDTDSDVSDGYHLSDDNASERWDCLECGIKNRPFVRYCAKCWQMRKNWLPDRPAKKKRKPRPKKKNQKAKAVMASGHSEQPTTSAAAKASLEQDTPQPSESPPKDTTKDSTQASSASSSSLNISTQESGISAEDTASASKDTTEAKDSVQTTSSASPGSSIGTQDSGISSQDLLESQDLTLVTVEVSGGRKRPCSEQGTTSKRFKAMESENEESGRGVDALAMELSAFITSPEGKAWLGTAEGSRYALALKSSLAYQNVKTKLITEYVSPEASAQLSVLCSVCFARPKNASIIHGRVSHQATCYPCAKRLHSIGAKCPVCRRKIHMVCKQIIA